MALTGAFIADFASFTAACAKAEVSLQGFESGSAKVEKSLNKMADSFSGRKIIQDAIEMARVFQNTDNGARLTTAELQRMGIVGEEALEKLRKTGERVPDNLLAMVVATRQIGETSDATKPKVGGLHDSLQSFDGILASMGIHIGPEIKAIGEIGAASATGAVGLGLVATAGLALGAGVAGWKIGRAAADFFDLDNRVAAAAARLFGFGDRDEQVAAANADKLAAATRMAGHEITDLGVATAILSAGMLTHHTAAEQSAAALAGWHGEIAKVQASGDFPSLTADLASQNFTLEELHVRYNVSVLALQVFQREQAAAAKVSTDTTTMIANNEAKLRATQHALDDNAMKLKASALLAVTKLEEEYNVLRVQHGGTANDIAIAQIVAWADVTEKAALKAGTATKDFYDALARDSAEKMRGVGIDWALWNTSSIKGLQDTADNAKATYDAMLASGGFFRAELDKQKDKWHAAADAARGYGKDAVDAEQAATAATKAHNEELAKAKQLADEAAAANRAMGGSTQYDLTTPEGRAQVPPDIAKLLHDGFSFLQASRAAYAMKMGFDISRDPLFATKGPRVAGFLGGGPTTEGLSYLHDAEYVVPKDGALVMRDRGGASVINHNTFYLVDNTENLARKVSALITRDTLRRGPLP